MSMTVLNRIQYILVLPIILQKVEHWVKVGFLNRHQLQRLDRVLAPMTKLIPINQRVAIRTQRRIGIGPGSASDLCRFGIDCVLIVFLECERSTNAEKSPMYICICYLILG